METRDVAVKPINDAMTANYPANCWWFAATSDEVTDKPVGGWYLDRPVVLYRTSDGTVAALDNRCPHRWAPLSEGRVEGDSIRCPYHGFRFTSDGACDDIPSQNQIPRACRVASYPTIERDGIIWLWLGDAQMAAQTALPVDTAWLTSPDCSVVTGTYMVDANYQNLKENVLDLTHLPHIHPSTIALNDWTDPPKVTIEDGVVTYRQDFPPTPTPAQIAFPLGLKPGHLAARYNIGRSLTPAVHHSELRVVVSDAEPGARSEFRLSIFHFTTPESPTRFRYQYYFGWDVRLPPEAVERMGAAVADTYAEDKYILEHVQRMIERDPRGANYPEMIVRADEAAIQSRRKLAALLAAEKPLAAAAR